MDDRIGIWELRWSARTILVYGAIVLLLACGPIAATVLDEHGIPGGIVVLGVLAFVAIASAAAVSTTIPSRRRARAMRRAATSLGLTFERRFALPEGIDELPCMRLIPIGNRFIASGFAGERDGRLIAVFSRSYTFDEYEATVWRSCAAARVDIEAPFLRVARQQGVTRLNFPRAYTVGMHRQNLEWEAFDRRWHVETRDRRFAVTLLDQRMMDWLMTCGNYAFETGGRWVMVETAGDDVEALQDLIDVLDGFVERVPPAALSIYAPA